MSSLNISRLFGSPALTSVENQVKDLIAAAEANVERLTTQIRELSLIRDKERSILATLRLMIVPIGKLPTELLVEIFKLVLDTGFESKYYSQWAARGAIRSVFCLSQVSSYWRQIVHNAPQLWAIGNFIEISMDRESKDQYLDGLEAVLTRSNPLQVPIALVQRAKNSRFHESSNTMARIVTPTAHRWKRLSIEMPSFLSFNKIPPGTFEALEYLSISGLEKQMDPVVVFQSSPRLLDFTFYSTFTSHSDSGLSKIHLLCLPWSQIVHLDITDVSLNACRTVLLQCNSLVSGEFTASDVWESASTGADRRSVVTPSEIHGIEGFLAPLALPSLKILHVDFEGGEAMPWPTQAVTLFQVRCPNIEQIELSGSSILSEGLIALLRNSPALTSLEIINCWSCINEHFWRALRYQVANPCPLAPKLRNLRLDCVGDTFTDGTMEATIRSRWWLDDRVSTDFSPCISRLESVSVTRFGEFALEDGLQIFSEEFAAQMQDMVNQGFNLELW
ncbi:hypothetical protein MSAN_00183300 [Mycena sanguinolenta]|uniref:F-box domain-containing protein n=1 Tax=Mycena sanguinolenta TaxID=230812 RepID=A0A8H7DKK5_9AGAR|nr:hypothetical protein MSAN_00183300 [Mycena sanguinolenta]